MSRNWAEGEIPYWLAAMEAGEAGAPMTEMAAGVPAASQLKEESQKKAGCEREQISGSSGFCRGRSVSGW